LIVGLGNPGAAYAQTRHNAGVMALEAVAERWRARWQGGLFRLRLPAALSWSRSVQGHLVRLARPHTFMNESGSAVRQLLRRLRVVPADCLVLCDDVNLPLGQLRLRAEGSAGGHHGLESIIQALETEQFPRLRLGIGRQEMPEQLTEFVLGRFTTDEQPRAREMVERAVAVCETWTVRGIAAAMNPSTRPRQGRGLAQGES